MVVPEPAVPGLPRSRAATQGFARSQNKIQAPAGFIQLICANNLLQQQKIKRSNNFMTTELNIFLDNLESDFCE